MFLRGNSILATIYSYKIDSELHRIKVSSDYTVKKELLKMVYSDMKKLSTRVYGRDEYKNYDGLRCKMLICEGMYCSDEYIVESKPIFSPTDVRFFNKMITSYDTPEQLLEHLVWFTRSGLLDLLHDADRSVVSLDDVSLVNECQNTSCLVQNLCNMFKIPCKTIKIPPAFTDSIPLLDGNGFHYFNMVSIGERDFIIDCTYRQFFRVDKNLIDRLGVFRTNGCDPGVYMMMNESRKNTAIHILKYGWIEATSENMKNYLDGFALASRNGLFYERHPECGYETSYTVRDYMNFLNGYDHQINHEPIECLGEQDYSLSDPKFKF